MTAAEKRDAAHVRMRRRFDKGFEEVVDWDKGAWGIECDMAMYRAGFLAALRYARDEMPRVLTDGELERVGAA